MFDNFERTIKCSSSGDEIEAKTPQRLRKDHATHQNSRAFLGRDIHKVDSRSTYSHKANADLLLGQNAKTFIANREENYMKSERISDFYSVVVQSVQYSCCIICY